MEVVNRHNKIAAGIIISIIALLAVYFVTSVYFMKHLYFGTKINGTDVSGKTVDETKAQMTSDLNNYALNIKERGGRNEQIKSEGISLRYKSVEQFKNFKDEQNPFAWISSFFNTKKSTMTAEILFDKDKLQEKVNNLDCLNDSNVTEPKEPTFKYANNTFVIVNEVKGNKVDKDILLKRIEEAISKKESTLDLESSGCYIMPKYTAKSKKVIEAKDMLNKYASSKITYTFGDKKVALDGSTINQWVSADNNFNIAVDNKKVKKYIESLSVSYNTAGKTRSFHTTAGNTINVSGGDYGWQININKETQALSETIKNGQTVSKEPAYMQTAVSHESNDIGNTYVEIDLTKQHLWFYKNGSLVVQGDVVTGNVSLNYATPPGIYRLKDKEKNYTLKGQDYTSPVCFWMPFNNGIGMHDASWRSLYGGEIYKIKGSHGCVNCPYNLAQTIFNNISVGTPVVCY